MNSYMIGTSSFSCSPSLQNACNGFPQLFTGNSVFLNSNNKMVIIKQISSVQVVFEVFFFQSASSADINPHVLDMGFLGRVSGEMTFHR